MVIFFKGNIRHSFNEQPVLLLPEIYEIILLKLFVGKMGFSTSFTVITFSVIDRDFLPVWSNFECQHLYPIIIFNKTLRFPMEVNKYSMMVKFSDYIYTNLIFKQKSIKPFRWHEGVGCESVLYSPISFCSLIISVTVCDGSDQYRNDYSINQTLIFDTRPNGKWQKAGRHCLS